MSGKEVAAVGCLGRSGTSAGYVGRPLLVGLCQPGRFSSRTFAGECKDRRLATLRWSPMSSSLRSFLSLLGLVGLLACALLFAYFPAVPRSVLGWVVSFLVGLPSWFALEWVGTTVLGSQFFARLSRPMRILLAVPALATIMILAVVVGQFFQRLVVSV